jgi:hypothetical protein
MSRCHQTQDLEQATHWGWADCLQITLLLLLLLQTCSVSAHLQSSQLLHIMLAVWLLRQLLLLLLLLYAT